MPDMSGKNFQPDFSSGNPLGSGDTDHMTLEELVALIQQAPDELFESSAQKTQRAQSQLAEGTAKLSAFHANPSPEVLKQAITHFRKAVELDPALAEAYIHLAQALWAEGNISLENALHYCELAIQHEPNNPSHYLATAEFLKQANEVEHIQRVFTLALRAAKPDQRFTVHTQQFLAACHTLHQVPLVHKPMALAKTLGIATQACLSWPAHVHRHGLAATAMPTSIPAVAKPAESTSPTSSAKTSLATATPSDAWWANLAANAIPLLPKQQWQAESLYWLHQKAPGQATLLTQLASLYLKMGKKDKATACFELLSQQYPNDAEIYATLGGLYSQTPQSLRAKRAYEQALAIQPERFEWLFELGQLQSDLQEYLPALISFKEALKQQPQHPMVLSNMAYVLFKLDDADGAIHCYQQALSHGTDPQWKSAVAQTLGALLYQHEDDTDGALEALNTAVHVDPYNTDARTMLAELLFELGEFDAALTHYNWLAQRVPDNADTHSHRGYILWQMDKNEEAIEAYEDALRCDPQNAVVYNNLGVVYLDEMLNGKEACRMFNEALNYQPQYTLAAFNLGRAYELCGKTQDAASAYGHALTLHEYNPEMDRADIEERLHALFDV